MSKKACMLALIACYSSFISLYSNEVEHIIFVHGTIFPTLALFNPVQTWKDLLNPNSRYLSGLKRLRQDPRLKESDVLGDLGIQEITAEIEKYRLNSLTYEEQASAAFQVIGAYDLMNNLIPDTSIKKRYYTYGWLGALSAYERRKAGHQLRKIICKLKKSSSEKSTIKLIAHSHGGTVCLYAAEKKASEKPFVEKLIMLGTPLEPHTISFIKNGFFKEIFNISSAGDEIQTKDIISTPYKCSYQWFSDLASVLNSFLETNTRIKLYDVHLEANGNSKAFNHLSLMSPDTYHVPYIFKRRRTKAIMSQLEPVPLVAFTPLILKLIQDLTEYEESFQLKTIKVNFKSSSELLALEARKDEQKVCFSSCQFNEYAAHVQLQMNEQWKPYAWHGDYAKTFAGIYKALIR